jgi:hypothetical protein
MPRATPPRKAEEADAHVSFPVNVALISLSIAPIEGRRGTEDGARRGVERRAAGRGAVTCVGMASADCYDEG